MLLAAAAVALLVGVELVSAAAGESRDLWGVVPVPDDAPGRMLALAATAGFFAGFLVLASRPGIGGPVLTVPGGEVIVRRRALDTLAAGAFASHPDVVSVRARTSLRDGSLTVDVRVVLRPGSDVATLGPTLQAAGIERLQAATGLASRTGRVTYKVLRVDQLARHL